MWQAANPPVRHWTGQVVWLVGASSGIGQACAQALHALGAHVVVSARNAERLQAWSQAHPGSLAVPCDVTDAASMARAAEAVWAWQGRLDCVVYAAGWYAPLRAQAWSLEQMLRHQQVNYIGALHCLDAVLPRMRAQGRGHISLISSVAGFRGLPRALAYGPTKAALAQLAETLYLDLQPEGLGVSVVHPGFVATPLTAQNDFEMPALITPEQAAQAMLQGWAQGAFAIEFPKRFTVVLRLLRCLPWRWYVPLVRRITGL